MQPESRGVFISWLPFQRRSETVARMLTLELSYFHYKWEEKNKAFKAFSYILKFISTLRVLFKKRPSLVFVQLAPTPPLYAVALYAAISRTSYVADCHNTMIYDGHWIKWPLAKYLLKKAKLVLVHNTEVKLKAALIGIETFIFMDPPPVIMVNPDISSIAGIRLREVSYVLLPSNMGAEDEPAKEFFEAARLMPETQFVLTGYSEKVQLHIRKMAPSNVKYTGYLSEDEFNALYKNATVALVLSTREGTQPSGASEAIALSVPLVVTELEITRKLYKDTVLYTKNNPSEIVNALNEAISNKDMYQQKIAETRVMIASETNRQSRQLLEFIDSRPVNVLKKGIDIYWKKPAEHEKLPVKVDKSN